MRAHLYACVADDTRGGPRGGLVVYTSEFIAACPERPIEGGGGGRWRTGEGAGREKESGPRTRARNLCSHYATIEIHYERHALSRGFGDLDLAKVQSRWSEGVETRGREGRALSTEGLEIGVPSCSRFRDHRVRDRT